MNGEQHQDRVFFRALRYALMASRGGIMRARILKALLEKPLNPLMVAKILDIDYKTALYHLEKMQKQNLVVKKGNEYGAVYAATFTPDQRAAFEHLLGEMGKSL